MGGARRPDPEEQNVFLCGLAGHAAAYRHHAFQHGTDTGAAIRYFFYARFTIRPRRPACRLRATSFRAAATIRWPPGFCSTIRCPTWPERQTTIFAPLSSPITRISSMSRLDRLFRGTQRVFGRLTYFRDDDTPVTPLPDGSGSHHVGSDRPDDDARLSGGGASIQLDALAARVESGALRLLPGAISNRTAPAERRHHRARHSRELLLFGAAHLHRNGVSADRGHHCRQLEIHHELRRSIMDTFSMVRGKHTFKFGADVRREALDVVNPPNPTGALRSPLPARTSPASPAAETRSRRCCSDK